MMRVINLAHGEFLMLGGYAAIVATSHGISIWLSMLVIAPIVVGIIGVIVERTIIRFLYGRMIDTMLATWGLSLFLVGLTTAIFGNTTVGISAPLGSFEIGAYRTSAYTLCVIAVAAVVLAAIFAVMRWTRLGLIARGTMQNANMAAALGVNPPRVYAVTFGIGAALSGLAGAVLAPVSGVFPTIGVAYVAKSFITVIGGGAAILSGTVSASALFGTINQVATFATTPVFGEVALLAYFMFYGLISDVYLGVITLTVTLILFNSVNSTAGPEFHIGTARLGGFNGIPGIPPLNYPGNKAAVIDLEGMFYLSTAALLATYFGLRLLLASPFGRIIVGIRGNERRAELLGYDPRAYKLATFTIGGALAGFAGCLFANWGNFVSPTIFGLAQSAQIIICVIVGGRGTLIGPI